MTGDEVRELRLALGLGPSQLRDLLGLGASTVHRWEMTGPREIAADPRNRELLDLLAALVARRTGEQARQLGRRIRAALGKDGGLYALHRVLALRFVNEFDGPASASAASVGER